MTCGKVQAIGSKASVGHTTYTLGGSVSHKHAGLVDDVKVVASIIGGIGRIAIHLANTPRGWNGIQLMKDQTKDDKRGLEARVTVAKRRVSEWSE